MNGQLHSYARSADKRTPNASGRTGDGVCSSLQLNQALQCGQELDCGLQWGGKHPKRWKQQTTEWKGCSA